MTLDAIGSLLPSAVGVALSPVPIIAIILMLGTPRAKVTGTAFAAGWIVGLALVSVVIVAVSNGADANESAPSEVVGWIKVAIGVLFLALAAKQWSGRPHNGDQPEQPRWMASIDTLGAGRSSLLGAALSGLNPKNLALTAAAALSIGQAGLDTGASAIAIAVFVVLGSLTVAGPTVWYLVAPKQAAAPLNSLKEFMSSHNAVIMMIVLLLLGTKLLGDGLGGITS